MWRCVIADVWPAIFPIPQWQLKRSLAEKAMQLMIAWAPYEVKGVILVDIEYIVVRQPAESAAGQPRQPGAEGNRASQARIEEPSQALRPRGPEGAECARRTRGDSGATAFTEGECESSPSSTPS